MEPHISEKLKDFRAKSGLSLREVAERADITLAALHRIESGKAKPRRATVEKISQALGIDIREFYDTKNIFKVKTVQAYMIDIKDLSNGGHLQLNTIKMQSKKIQLHGLQEGENYATKITDRQHEPHIKEGSIIVFRPIPETEFENNRYYILIIDNTPIIRKVTKKIGGDQSGHFDLSNKNETQTIAPKEIQAWYRITHTYQEI